MLRWLRQHEQQPRRLLFVSSTGVYAQRDGEWIDEDSPTEPTGFTGQVMLEAEQLALGCGLPATCVRMGGLYDPSRPWLQNQVRAGLRVERDPPQYSNRHSPRRCRRASFPSCCRRTPAAPRCSPATWGRRRAGAAARGGRLAARAAGCHPLGRAEHDPTRRQQALQQCPRPRAGLEAEVRQLPRRLCLARAQSALVSRRCARVLAVRRACIPSVTGTRAALLTKP